MPSDRKGRSRLHRKRHRVCASWTLPSLGQTRYSRVIIHIIYAFRKHRDRGERKVLSEYEILDRNNCGQSRRLFVGIAPSSPQPLLKSSRPPFPSLQTSTTKPSVIPDQYNQTFRHSRPAKPRLESSKPRSQATRSIAIPLSPSYTEAQPNAATKTTASRGHAKEFKNQVGAFRAPGRHHHRRCLVFSRRARHSTTAT